MSTTLASHILDAIRDHMHLHVGFCLWTRDDGVMLRVCSARSPTGSGGWRRGADVVPTPSTPDSDPESSLNQPIWLLAPESDPILGLLPVHWRVGEG